MQKFLWRDQTWATAVTISILNSLGHWGTSPFWLLYFTYKGFCYPQECKKKKKKKKKNNKQTNKKSFTIFPSVYFVIFQWILAWNGCWKPLVTQIWLGILPYNFKLCEFKHIMVCKKKRKRIPPSCCESIIEENICKGLGIEYCDMPSTSPL